MTEGDQFRGEWEAATSASNGPGTKHVHHPLVGDHVLAYEVVEPPADLGLEIITHSAERGT